MLLPAQHLVLYIDPWGELIKKHLLHIIHYLTSAKAIPMQEVQKLLCVDAATSDAENLCMWCLARLVDIFLEICSKTFRTNLQD